MNFISIILILIIVTVLIYTYYLFTDNYLIKDPKSLNQAPPFTISASDFASPGSLRYYYEGWIYIDSNIPVDTYNVIWNRGKDFVLTLKGSALSIYINGLVDANGIYDIGSDGVKLLDITKSFPFQKWVHCVINVDSGIFDCYLNGQLVNTFSATTNPNVHIKVDDKTPIGVGNKYTNGYICKFKRLAENVDPQTVWNKYSRGVGNYMMSSPYKLDMNISKNDEIKQRVHIV